MTRVKVLKARKTLAGITVDNRTKTKCCEWCEQEFTYTALETPKRLKAKEKKMKKEPSLCNRCLFDIYIG